MRRGLIWFCKRWRYCPKASRDIVEKLSILRSLPVDEEVDMVEVKEVKDHGGAVVAPQNALVQ